MNDGATPSNGSDAGATTSVDNWGDGGMSLDSDAATTISVGDFDHISDELPKIPPGISSASFFWGGPSVIHLGNWFVASATGIVRDAQVDAIEPPRGDSTKACHVSGAQFAQGLDLFAQLNHPTGSPISLSSYAGLAFWARTAAPAKLSVVLNDGTGSLKKEGSWDGLFSASFAASAEWQRFELPFGDPASVSAVASIDFVVLAGGEGVELWIDDLTFFCRGACQ